MGEAFVSFKNLPDKDMQKIMAKAVVVGCDMVPAEMSGEARCHTYLDQPAILSLGVSTSCLSR